eukprot:3989266-Heterocapsa_arctica.AAC.1
MVRPEGVTFPGMDHLAVFHGPALVRRRGATVHNFLGRLSSAIPNHCQTGGPEPHGASHLARQLPGLQSD